jgi:hypothetical protein
VYNAANLTNAVATPAVISADIHRTGSSGGGMLIHFSFEPLLTATRYLVYIGATARIICQAQPLPHQADLWQNRFNTMPMLDYV